MGWIIFGIIMLILLFLLFSPVKLYIKFWDKKFSLGLGYLFIKKQIIDPDKPKKKKPEKKPKKKKEKEEEEKKKGGILPDTVSGKIDFILSAVKAGGRFLRRFTRLIHLRDIVLDITVSDENAETCAVSYGKINIIVYNAFNVLRYFFKLKPKSLRIDCEYNKPKSVCNTSLTLWVRPGAVIAIALAFAFSVLIALIKSRLSSKKNEDKNKDVRSSAEKEFIMAENHTIGNIMGITMEKLKDMVDVNTIIGEPIELKDGTAIIPISKVSFGFASGGSDLPAKSDKELFGGGSGAGVSIQPLAFLVVYKGEAKLMQMSNNVPAPNALASMVPEIIDKVSGMMNKKKNKDEEKTGIDNVTEITD